MKPGFHCVRTHWIRGFITFHRVRHGICGVHGACGVHGVCGVHATMAEPHPALPPH